MSYDDIVVMSEGQIVERGNPDDLLHQDTFFKGLAMEALGEKYKNDISKD